MVQQQSSGEATASVGNHASTNIWLIATIQHLNFIYIVININICDCCTFSTTYIFIHIKLGQKEKAMFFLQKLTYI